MKKLTAGQLLDIQSLVKNHNHLVSQASIDFHENGLVRVTVISALDADWDDLNGVIEDIFPDFEYRGTSAEYPSNDGTRNELHAIDYNGETLINLCMKKAPVDAGAAREISHLDCTINLAKVELLMGCGMK